MKINKKIIYIVSPIEFEEINKNYFIAGILAIFLGMFGIHRFYLKKPITGFVFFIISFISIEFGGANMSTIIMFISIIEGIIYLFRGVGTMRKKLFDYITEKNIKTYRNEEITEPEIIEVSKIRPNKISRETEFGNIIKTNWIKKLRIPYERGIMRVVQIKEETVILYVELCNFIDMELRNDKSSLNKEIRRIQLEGRYYNNILYTIYCISEGHVTKAYSGNYNYYNPEFSYGILEEHLGKGLKDKVFSKAGELETKVTLPNGETQKYFHLTKTGVLIKWWDRDGSFRLEREFRQEELNALNVTPSRNTKVWEVLIVKKHIIELYLEFWKTISNSLNNDIKWNNKNKKSLREIIDGKYTYFADYDNGNILASLIKLSENSIRELMPNTQILNVNNELNNINKYLPSQVVQEINSRITKYKESITDKNIQEVLKGMLDNDPSDWKLKVEDILIQDDKRIDKLIDYKKDKNFIRIAKEVIKNTEDKKLILPCLYAIEREENLNQKSLKLLQNIIHPSNISDYKNIVESKEVLSLDLLGRLLDLMNPIRKKIELNMDKVKESKEELHETVGIIKEYIGDKEEIEKVALVEIIEEVKEFNNIRLEYETFLKLVLNTGSIDVDEGKEIALDNGTLLNSFISNVNQELYEYTQDQTVIIEDNNIKIDEFYVEIVKELLMYE